MALKALIPAYHDSAEYGALRSTLQVAGSSVLERQARFAVAAGASNIIIVAERMPTDLARTLDRLRGEKMPVQLARSAEEAAAAVDANDQLILVADGMVTEPAQLARLAAEAVPAVMTVPDSGLDETHERIDATHRWAGLASFSGAHFTETVSMLKDWDLQSTLLRRTLQAGARLVPAERPVAIIDRQDDVARLEQQIMRAASEPGGDWISRLLAPAERAAVNALLKTNMSADTLGMLVTVLAAGGAIAFARSWLWLGLLLFLAANFIWGAAGRLARIRMRHDFEGSWPSHLLPILAGGGLLALCYSLAPIHGWGMIVFGVMVPVFLVAARIERGGREVRRQAALPTPRNMAWTLLPFAICGLWHVGIIALFLYAIAAFFWVQHEVHHPAPDAEPDVQQ